jgi:3beta-hydroxy-delta5-steroid dehydrogenase/steroid delta-isomerase
MFRKVFENVIAGNTKVLVGNKNIKLDNSYVHNLIHGLILAAEHLVPGGTAPGQA